MIPEVVIGDGFESSPVTKQALDSIFTRMKVDFLKSGSVLKRNSKKRFTKNVPLKKFKLKKGIYYLQFVYYSGRVTSRTIDAAGVDQCQAKLFQVCAISDRIPLIVK